LTSFAARVLIEVDVEPVARQRGASQDRQALASPHSVLVVDGDRLKR
jgi:hypothetical protein